MVEDRQQIGGERSGCDAEKLDHWSADHVSTGHLLRV